MGLIEKVLIGILSLSLLSGFIANIYLFFVMKDTGFVQKAFIALGKAFLQPQLAISSTIQNFSPSVGIIFYIIIFAYSLITLIYLKFIWIFTKLICGKLFTGFEPPVIITGLMTLIIFWLITGFTGLLVSGNFIWNPFQGWTDLILKVAQDPTFMTTYVTGNIPV